MSRRVPHPGLLIAAAFGLSACKLTRNDEQSGRVLPPPEPAASIQPARPAEAEPPAPVRKEAERAPSHAPKAAEPATAPAAASPPEAPTSAPTLPAAPAAAGAPGVANPACLPKCQASLQTCVAQPGALDAGLPSLEAMAECRKAFEDCRNACAP